MNAIGLSDFRKIPDEVMNYLRRIAVRAVEENHYSPELIAKVLGVSRSCIYDWLRWYRAGGEAALDTRSAPGADPVITPEMDQWLKTTILDSTPVDHGYETELWTLKILVELLQQRFGVWVADSTVALHLHQLDLSCQHPRYRAREQNPEAVAHFLLHTFPKIQRLAEKIGAEIGFEDEAGVGVGILARAGRTWGEVGTPPVVSATDQRGGYIVLSLVTAAGRLRYSIEAHSIASERYIAFLQQVLRGRTRPLILIADRASFHRSVAVRQFVRAHRTQIRLFFFPAHSPELNPDEPVWNEIKHRRLGKQPIKTKADLKKKLDSALKSLQHKTERIRSFFKLPDTQYAAIQESA